MPWKETIVMDLKISMLSDWLSGSYSKTMLADKYHLSRPTVNKWLSRYQLHGINGLVEQSRKPILSPNQTPDHIVDLIIESKISHAHWGPKKINDLFKRQHPELSCPSDSTTGNILKRAGLVKPRARPKQGVSPFHDQLTQSTKPCQVWNIDFKGHATLGNDMPCYPFTVTDDFTRYILDIKALKNTSHNPVKHCFERLFHTFGLPECIKSDNGSPFASTAIAGLSHLSVWFIKLGITPERIQKGKPTQNGKHERMHRTLKAETMDPMCHSMTEQQAAFDRFRLQFNQERSHEGIHRQTPASVFKPSTILYTGKEPEVHYDLSMTVRRVRCNGEFRWQGHLIYLSRLLAKQQIALRQTHDSTWQIFFGFMLIGYLNEQTMKVERIKKGK